MTSTAGATSEVLELRPSGDTYKRNVRRNWVALGGFVMFSVARVLTEPGPGAWLLLAGIVGIAAFLGLYFLLSRVRLTDTEISWRRPTGLTYRCDADRIERVVVVKEFVNMGGRPWRETYVKVAGDRSVLRLHAFYWAVEDQDRLVTALSDRGCDVRRYGTIGSADLDDREPGLLRWVQRHELATVVLSVIAIFVLVGILVVAIAGLPK